MNLNQCRILYYSHKKTVFSQLHWFPFGSKSRVLTILGENHSQIFMKVGVDVQQKAWSMCCEKAKCNIFLGHDSIHINGRA